MFEALRKSAANRPVAPFLVIAVELEVLDVLLAVEPTRDAPDDRRRPALLVDRDLSPCDRYLGRGARRIGTARERAGREQVPVPGEPEGQLRAAEVKLRRRESAAEGTPPRGPSHPIGPEPDRESAAVLPLTSGPRASHQPSNAADPWNRERNCEAMTRGTTHVRIASTTSATAENPASQRPGGRFLGEGGCPVESPPWCRSPSSGAFSVPPACPRCRSRGPPAPASSIPARPPCGRRRRGSSARPCSPGRRIPCAVLGRRAAEPGEVAHG